MKITKKVGKSGSTQQEQTKANRKLRLPVKAGRGKLIVGILIILFMIAGLLGGYYIFRVNKAGADSSKKQAVFLTNGQIYFGEISRQDEEYVVLKNIYYLKNQESLATTEGKTNISLIKLGQELHGPQDIMYVNRDHILFYEEMRIDSKINQAIEKYLSERANQSANPTPAVTPEG